jgi:hypothetical protein
MQIIGSCGSADRQRRRFRSFEFFLLLVVGRCEIQVCESVLELGVLRGWIDSSCLRSCVSNFSGFENHACFGIWTPDLVTGCSDEVQCSHR